MFRFATGTGRHIHEWSARKLDHHLLPPCRALWGRALALLTLLTLLSPLLERLRLPAASCPPRRAAAIPSCALLLPSDFMRLHMRCRMRVEGPAAMADCPNPGPTSELPVMPASTLLVIARRRIRGAFMHARAGEAGSRPLGRR